MSPKFGINFLASPTFLSHIRLQFFYNNLTAWHCKLQVFLEIMDNHCVMHVIRIFKINVAYQNFSTDWIYIKIINIFKPLKSTTRKITTHCSAIHIIPIKLQYIYWRFFRITIFHVFVICFTVSFSNVRNSSYQSFFKK